MRARNLIAALILSFGAAAWADKPAPAKADDGEAFMTFMEKVADIVDKNQADCDKMGTALGKYVDDNSAEIQRLKDLHGKMSADDRKALREKYKDRMRAALGKMMEGGKKCHDNAKVKAAMDKIHVGGGAHKHGGGGGGDE